MRTAVIDPGDFSPQYNLALTSALSESGDHCELIGRHGFDETAKPLFRRDHFYAPTLWPGMNRLPPAGIKLLKGLSHGPDLWRLQQRLRREAFDVVHFQWLPLPMIDRLFWRRWSAAHALIVTMHDSNPYNGGESGLMARGLDQLLMRADAVIVHTAQAARRLTERGLAKNLIHQVPHGLLHKPVKRAVRPVGDRLKLLQFGKIKHYKGVDILIEALRQLGPAIRQRLDIRVVGKPYMDMQPLQQQIAEHGLAGCIRLELGYLPEAQIETLFADADVALFPYREIDASGVVMTAIAQGLPVIASEVGGFAELFGDQQGGNLFPLEDATALARLLEKWATDPALLVHQSKAILQKRDAVPEWHMIAKTTRQIYQDVLARKASLRGTAENAAFAGGNG